MGALLSFPLFRLRGDYFAFATLALLPLFELLASNLVPITRGADGILLPPSTAMIHGIDVKMYAYYVALAGSVAVFVLSIWMSRTPFGYALKAIRNDEQAAEVVGIRIFPVKLQAMAYGAMAAAIAGARLYLVVPLHRSAHRVRPRRRAHSGRDGAARRLRPAVGTADRRGPAVGRHPASDRQADDAAVHHHRARHPADRPLHAGRAAARALGAARPAARAARPRASRADRGGQAVSGGAPRQPTGCRLRRSRTGPLAASCWRRATSPWRSAAMSPSTG